MVPADDARGPEGLSAAFSAFLAEHPRYERTAAIDELRALDYTRLDDGGHVYLDYTGGGLYAASQLEAHHALLTSEVLGNPHSANPTSLMSTQLVDEARRAVHEYFNASEDDYEIVFTHNASGALKLVGEAYPFGPNSCYLVSYDNHNSVNGIREFARARGARVVYVPVRKPELRLDEQLVMRGLREAGDCPAKLFAYPAQSNFSGVQHPLEWVDQAHALGWDVLLDSAAFVPTNRLDLSAVKPDFVPVSFYKMFGYPTGAGALIVRRDALAKLQRPWFAGGTITLASVQDDGWHHLAPGHQGFEDGTVDYLGLSAVTLGLRHLSRVGVAVVHDRVSMLAGWLLERMRHERHSNGTPLFRVFGPDLMESRGATIAFYLLDPAGEVFDVHTVEKLAGSERISVRTGCFCNPGDGEIAHEITRDEMAGCFEEPSVPVTFEECSRLLHDASGRTPNTIRVSLGIASNFADVYAFMRFAGRFRDLPAASLADR